MASALAACLSLGLARLAPNVAHAACRGPSRVDVSVKDPPSVVVDVYDEDAEPWPMDVVPAPPKLGELEPGGRVFVELQAEPPTSPPSPRAAMTMAAWSSRWHTQLVVTPVEPLTPRARYRTEVWQHTIRWIAGAPPPAHRRGELESTFRIPVTGRPVELRGWITTLATSRREPIVLAVHRPEEVERQARDASCLDGILHITTPPGTQLDLWRQDQAGRWVRAPGPPTVATRSGEDAAPAAHTPARGEASSELRARAAAIGAVRTGWRRMWAYGVGLVVLALTLAAIRCLRRPRPRT